MKDLLRSRISETLQGCYQAGTLSSGVIPDFVIEVPGQSDHGDFATNVAMMLARDEKRAPRQIAEIIVAALGSDPLWSSVEIAGPGFINLFIANHSWYGLLDEVMQKQAEFGKSDVGKGHKVQVEFVSANPTGPLHIGHGRGAATGDAVASLLDAAGYDVQREYYINDAGNQMDTLGRSLWLRWRELNGEVLDFPEDCYQGDYIRELVSQIDSDKLADVDETEAISICGQFGGKKILDGIREDLIGFGVTLDNWYSEKAMVDSGAVQKGLAILAEKDLSYEQDGAVWFRTTDFGDDKDRVLVRSSGATTYYASDVAYHLEKFSRGFETVIDVWGADHHGYVARMKALLSGLGRDPEGLQVILVQLVNLLRGGDPVAMSTRSGEFVTLQEVVDEVGRDACRFFFLMRRSDSHLDFDLELAKQQNSDNPVYYVQYAHARVCSINRNAADQGVTLPKTGDVDFSRLERPDELALAKFLARFPETVVGAADNHEPHRIVFYLQELSAQLHSYYNRTKVLVDDMPTSQARLYLVNCVRIVLANALHILGVSAPESM